MNFWNDIELAQRFKADKVPAKEKLHYLLGLTLITIFSTISLGSVNVNLDGWDFIGSIATLILSIMGILYCYNTNSNGDNKEFIERYIIFSFPIGIRSLVFFIIFSIVFYIVILGSNAIFSLALSEKVITGSVNLLSSCAFFLYYFMRLNNAIRLAAFVEN